MSNVDLDLSELMQSHGYSAALTDILGDLIISFVFGLIEIEGLKAQDFGTEP